jgi:hypothetical protein
MDKSYFLWALCLLINFSSGTASSGIIAGPSSTTAPIIYVSSCPVSQNEVTDLNCSYVCYVKNLSYCSSSGTPPIAGSGCSICCSCPRDPNGPPCTGTPAAIPSSTCATTPTPTKPTLSDCQTAPWTYPYQRPDYLCNFAGCGYSETNVWVLGDAGSSNSRAACLECPEIATSSTVDSSQISSTSSSKASSTSSSISKTSDKDPSTQSSISTKQPSTTCSTGKTLTTSSSRHASDKPSSAPSTKSTTKKASVSWTSKKASHTTQKVSKSTSVQSCSTTKASSNKLSTGEMSLHVTHRSSSSKPPFKKPTSTPSTACSSSKTTALSSICSSRTSSSRAPSSCSSSSSSTSALPSTFAIALGKCPSTQQEIDDLSCPFVCYVDGYSSCSTSGIPAGVGSSFCCPCPQAVDGPICASTYVSASPPSTCVSTSKPTPPSTTACSIDQAYAIFNYNFVCNFAGCGYTESNVRVSGDIGSYNTRAACVACPLATFKGAPTTIAGSTIPYVKLVSGSSGSKVSKHTVPKSPTAVKTSSVRSKTKMSPLAATTNGSFRGFYG